MRYDDSHESPDVIDRRGEPSPGGGDGGAGLMFLVFWLLRRPWGWVVLLLGGVAYLFVRATATVDGSHGLHADRGAGPVGPGDQDAPEVHFVSYALDDIQSTWSGIFAQRGDSYRHAKLVLYTDATRTGCGLGSAATGPFYCPQDERVYLDLGFFRELSGKLGAHGQFAQAYVIAHEVGHHVQTLLGTMDPSVGPPGRGADGRSVRIELQADCYAGIWAHSAAARDQLDPGDIESALSAAAAVGDDRLQRMETGTVSPESWTHGSSAERARWFTRGYTSGRLESCDTFGRAPL